MKSRYLYSIEFINLGCFPIHTDSVCNITRTPKRYYKSSKSHQGVRHATSNMTTQIKWKKRPGSSTIAFDLSKCFLCKRILDHVLNSCHGFLTKFYRFHFSLDTTLDEKGHRTWVRLYIGGRFPCDLLLRSLSPNNNAHPLLRTSEGKNQARFACLSLSIFWGS